MEGWLLIAKAGDASVSEGGGVETLRLRPHPLFVILRTGSRFGWLIGGAVVVYLCMGLLEALLDLDVPGRGWVVRGAVIAVVGQFVWNVLEYFNRWYEMEGGRIRRTGGVLHRYADEIRLSDIRAVSVDQPLIQRFFGLGTLGFGSAATGGVEIAWVIIDRVKVREVQVRRAVEAARGGGGAG